MPFYRKKPVVIEAIRYNGDNEDEILRWCKGAALVKYGGELTQLTIVTLEGSMLVSPGDYVISGVGGEFYPCKPDIFAATYEEVEESDANRS